MLHGMKVGLEAALIDSLPISGSEMDESRKVHSSELDGVVECHGEL
jgi:hypothetical protein